MCLCRITIRLPFFIPGATCVPNHGNYGLGGQNNTQILWLCRCGAQYIWGGYNGQTRDFPKGKGSLLIDIGNGSRRRRVNFFNPVT